MQCTVHWAPKGAATTVVGLKSSDWDMEEEARRERRRRLRQRLVGYCKSTAAFLFSHIGLAGLVVAYSIVGGFLFQALEAPFEESEKRKLMEWKNQTIMNIARLAMRRTDGDNFTQEIRKLLNDFQFGVIIAMKEVGWDGKDLSDDTDLRWSYAGALLYAVTVITTIGYGHLAPKTPLGRFLTIIYALIGIPLTFLYLSIVGNFLADAFRLFYKHICCDICWCRRFERKKKQQRLHMRKQRKRMAQRNAMLSMTSMDNIRFTIEGEVSENDDTAGESGYIDDAEAGVSLLGPCHNGPVYITPSGDSPGIRGPSTDAELELNLDDSACANRSEANGTDSGIGVKSNLDELSRRSDPLLNNQIDYGALRETDILDSFDDDDGEELLTLEMDMSNKECGENNEGENDEGTDGSVEKMDLCATGNFGFLEQLRDAKETDILDDSCDDLMTFHSPEEMLVRNDSDRSQRCDAQCPQNASNISSTIVDANKLDSVNSSTKTSDDTNAKTNETQQISPNDDASGQKQNEEPKHADTNVETSDVCGIETGDHANEAKCRDDATKTDSPVLKNGVSFDQTNRTTKVVPDKSEQIVTANVERLKLSESEPISKKQSLKIKFRSNNKKITRSNTTKAPSHRKCSSLRRPRRERPASSDAMPCSDEESFVTAQTDPDSSSYQTLGVSAQSFLLDDVGNTVALPTKRPQCSSVVTFQPESGSRTSPCSYDVTKMDTMTLADDVFDIDESEEKVTVPICVCLLIIATYVIAGSILFTLWEDWDPLTGSYFCFITLSTIGFGDIVPGTDMKEWSSQEKLVLCSLWLAFGLSLLAMCFNLMQEEVKGKCKWIGKKVGLLTNDNDG